MMIKELIKKQVNLAKGWFPTALPQGVTEFETWAQSVLDTYNPPMEARSAKFAMCAMIMRLGPTESRKSKRYFGVSLHRGAAGEVANYMMAEYKKQQKAEIEAAEAQLVEATTPKIVDESQIPDQKI